MAQPAFDCAGDRNSRKRCENQDRRQADRVVVKQEHLLQTSRDEADQDNGASGQNSRGDCPDQKKLLCPIFA